jgi:hypothetical protein
MSKKNIKNPKMCNLPLFFDTTLNPNNRWVRLASIIPWETVEEMYSKNFKGNKGPKPFPARVALGSLIIQLKLNLSDEETVEQITENPYLQYFIGFEEYQEEPPFDSSLMTHFRKRLSVDNINGLNELIHQESYKKTKNDSNDDNDDDPPNKGKLIVDATCAPADIHYPTDLGLLNKAREKTEEMIDILWKRRSNKENKVKPKDYRKKARARFIGVVSQKRPTKKKVRAAIRIQLNSISRNLKTIDKLLNYCELKELGSKLYKDLLVIQTLYLQQKEMFDKKKRNVKDRIVSIQQPHIRPIVRGKAGSPTEFGAKLSISLVDGWSFIDTISFDAYNEGGELQEQIEKYKERFGYYPESVHADQIYRNKENRNFCKERSIRLSGPKLGRPTKNEVKLKEEKQEERRDEGVRSAVEGRFGVIKRRYGLNKIMTKLQNTSKNVIALLFLVMNIDALIDFLCQSFTRSSLLYRLLEAMLKGNKLSLENCYKLNALS